MKNLSKFAELRDFLRARVEWLVFFFGLAVGFFFSQGIPLWDDDFASIFDKIQSKSVWQIFTEWISPISTQPQFWGFNERPVQALLYKIFYLLNGYDSGLYFLYKNLMYAGLAWILYRWSLRLIGPEPRARWMAVLPAVFFLFCPGPISAHFLHSDLATTSQFLFLLLTYFIWDAVEATPIDWRGWLDLRDQLQRAWLRKWMLFSFVTYLSYKSKADLKMIPVILTVYLFLVRERRRQWRLFAVPLVAMFLLAIPWGPGIFSKLPPFLPGSHGSEIGWMWQPLTGRKLLDFVWSQFPWDLGLILQSPTISLFAILGPFLLVPMLAFLVWKARSGFALKKLFAQDSGVDRSRIFVTIWFVVMIAAVGSLPALNLTFRVRYGIMPLVPMTLLMAWTLGLFLKDASHFPRWAIGAVVALFAVQGSINFYRSIQQRAELGAVMNAVDQMYEYMNTQHPQSKLVSVEGFLSYYYHTDANPVVRDREILPHFEDVGQGHFAKGDTYIVSWVPTLWDEVEYVKTFSGCRENVLFNVVARCQKRLSSYLFRYVGPSAELEQAKKLNEKSDFAGALRLHEKFASEHPNNLAVYFAIGVEAWTTKNFTRANEVWNYLEFYFPQNLSVVYNHGLALKDTQNFTEAVRKFNFVLEREPKNYGALVNSFYSYKKMGDEEKAAKIVARLRADFPEDSVWRGLAGEK